MRKIAIAALLGGSMLSTPAVANEDGLYGTLFGGPTIVGDENYETDAGADLFGVEGGLGGALGGNLGYDYGKFRLELESAFYNQSVDDVTIDPGNAAATALGTSGTLDAQGNRRAITAMLNGVIDIDSDSDWTPFLGAGAGWGFVANRNIRAVAGDVLDQNTSGPAVQVMAGVRRQISEVVDFAVQFRHTRIFSGDIENAFGEEVGDGFNATSFLASLNFYFDRQAAAPVAAAAVVAAAPPPPPPPPPPPVVTAATPGPFIVFFDWDEAAITPDAAAIIRDAADAYNQTGQSRILLEGFADTSGAPAYNDRLSARRAAAVEAELEKYGISGSAISQEAFGESRLRMNTLDGVREPQNRRVQINLGN